MALLALALAGRATPQDVEPPQKNTALIKPYPHLDKITNGVESLVKDGKWSSALTVLTDAAQSHPNHLVPMPGGAKGSPIQYVGVVEYGRHLISSWVAESEDARSAVRAFFDPLAKADFENARSVGDRALLTDLIERYPFSSVADDALLLRGSIEFDAGESARAIETFERLAAWKETDIPIALIYARLGQSYARAGRREQLAALVSKADRDAGSEKVSAGSTQTTLGEFLRAELKRTVQATATATEAASGWEHFQGSADGTRVVEATDLGQYAWKGALELARFTEADDRFQYGRAGSVPPTYRPFFPAVSDGIVYTHGEFSVAAYNLFGAGELLWQHKERAPMGDLMYDDRVMHSVTVSEGRVYANLITWLDEYETQHSFITVKFPFPKRALFCFDAYSGRLLWRMGGRRKAEQFEEGLSFSVPPTPHNGLLYATAIKQDHQTDPFEHHVICIDPAAPEGKRVLWSTFVASGGTEINLFGNSTRESLTSPVAVTDESVFCCTNHGAVGALDRRTGRLRWVAKYEQLPVNPTRSVNVRRNPPEWCPGAPVVGCGQVCVAPTDSPELYAFDVRDGRRVWERGRARDIRYLYGITGTKLVVGGDAIEWYDLAAQGKLLDRFSPMQGGRGTGRGLIAADGVYLPMTEGLYKVKSGKVKADQSFLRWPGRTDGGNLVVADGALLVASLDEVVAFYDRKDVERQIREELEKDPNNAALLYRASLRLLQSGKAEESVDLLAKVSRLTAGSTRPSDERLSRASKRRLYAVASKLGQEAMVAKQFDRATTHFRRARDAAPDLASMIDATVSVAAALVARQETAAALDEYHRLIEKQGDDVRAFEAARQGVAELLQATGRGAYQACEREAEALSAKAESADALLAVYRRWPNSLAAEKAMLKAAEKAAAPAEAASTLRLFLQCYPDSARVVEAQTSLVKSLESQGLYAAAATVLKKMLRGGAKQFAETQLAKEEYKRLASGSQVPLRPPLAKLGAYADKDFADGSPLRVQGPPFIRGSGFVFMSYRGMVKAVDLAKGAEAWKLAVEGPVRAAFSYDDALILGGGSTIVRVNPQTGAVEWKVSRPVPFNAFQLASGAICFLSPDPRNEMQSQVGAVDATKGVTLWVQNHEGIAVPRLVEHGDAVCFASEAPNRVHVVDVESGKRTWKDMQFGAGNVDVLGVVDGLLVLHMAGRAVETYQLPQATFKWRRSLEGLDLRAIDASPSGVFLLAERTGQDWQKEIVAYLIDNKTGKIARMRERPDLDEPLEARLEGDRVVVFSRSADGGLKVRGLSLSDLGESWKVDFGTTLGRVGGVVKTPGLIVVVGGERLEGGTFNYSVVLLDPGGRKVQAFKGDGSYERPPGWTVSSGRLIFSVDNRVEVWGTK